MIVVRNCFVCKPGNASKLAAKLKEAAAAARQPVELTITDPGSDDRTALRWRSGPMAARVAPVAW